MQTAEALRIIQALADGVDPNTGEVLPEDGPYQHPQIVRALNVAVNVLQKRVETEGRNRRLPERTGEAWDEEEEKGLMQDFDAGTDVAKIAKQHQRTRGAIRARLERLGRIPPTGRYPRD